MFSLKPVLFFAAKILIFYLLLIALFTWWGASYTKTLNKLNTFVFENYGSNGLVRFKINKPKKTPFSIKMEIISKKMARQVQRQANKSNSRKKQAGVKMLFYQFDAWLFAVLPLIIVLSFVLASPIPPLQMLKALGIGIVLSQLLVLFKIGITITDEVYLNPWLQIDDSLWQTIFANPSATTALKDIFKYVGFSLIFSVLIWAGAAFNGKDWRKFGRIIDKMGI